jgi:uncharacterized protein (DUF1778 family)
MKMKIKDKDETINIRVNNSMKDTLNYAATLNNLNLSAYILQIAMREAKTIIEEKKFWILKNQQWKDFCKFIYRKPRVSPKLRNFLEEESVFENKRQLPKSGSFR